MPKISAVHARQILDSRGNPTIEVDITLDDGAFGRAAVPSGASTGSHEAVELRDQDPHLYLGKSVLHAIEHVNNEIAQFLANNDPMNQVGIDNEMILRDGTQNTGRLGANAVLGVSLALSKAVAASLKIPYYRYIAQLYQTIQEEMQFTVTPQSFEIPRPMFNVLNGGAHTSWETTDIQEFMIIPVQKKTFSEHLRMSSEIYHHLERVLDQKGYSTMVGDEGGFAPQLKSDEEAIEILLTAITNAGYKPGEEVAIGLDAAMSELWKDDHYEMKVHKQNYTSEQLISMWQEWLRQFPIISLEDGLAEDDWAGWNQLNATLGKQVQIVGDDLLVTNIERIQKAIDQQSCNALLMKVNQIGTLTESLQAIALSKHAGWQVIVSHRSGETEDSSIADIVVGTSAGQIKAGAPARSERLAKYNQLLRIEEELTRQPLDFIAG
jgi:enolase